MKPNQMKAKLLSGKPVFGCIAPNSDPTLIETLGLIGFDYHILDCEHGPSDMLEVENFARACEVRGMTPLARVRELNRHLILQFMDAGIMGLIVPGMQNAEMVREMVNAVKYPPTGDRGLGPIRAADYMLGEMSQEEYVKYANEQTMVFPLFEDIEALENLDEMVKVPGVDGLIIGPRDLAMSMGYIDGPAGHDDVKEVVDKVIKTVLVAGLFVGTVAPNGSAAKSLVERGVQICLGGVNGLLVSAGRAYLNEAKS
jgi:4-hydroxy-2-oxoheptanedioate aldolase|tara:strand:+ start:9527 stop:10294 length:768 start_codon:yes stop_codon:yes gene_type:complete